MGGGEPTQQWTSTQNVREEYDKSGSEAKPLRKALGMERMTRERERKGKKREKDGWMRGWSKLKMQTIEFAKNETKTAKQKKNKKVWISIKLMSPKRKHYLVNVIEFECKYFDPILYLLHVIWMQKKKKIHNESLCVDSQVNHISKRKS